MTKPATLTVDLGERSYPIIIGGGLLGNFDLTPHLQGPDCLVVTNETVGPLYLERLLENFEVNCSTISLPDGEKYKTNKSAASVIDELVACSANRDTTVVALGGGVVGDIAGFAAACYMRVVAFIQIPTTLLAQVDSSVGGKTGVNHSGGKNLIGAFHQPQAVLIDTDTLATLPERELRAGLAEVQRIKLNKSTLGSLRKRIETDPADVDARYELALKLQRFGDAQGYRKQITAIHKHDPAGLSFPSRRLLRRK